MKELVISTLIIFLIATACTKTIDNEVKNCAITYQFERINTKGIKQSSNRIYSAYCIDLKNYIKETNLTFKKEEPTATNVKYKAYSK